MPIQAHTRMFDPDIDVRPGGFRPWELRSRVHTQAEFLNLPSWEAVQIIRSSGGTVSGGSATVSGLPTTVGGAPSALNFGASLVKFYRIQVVSPANAVLVADVPFLVTNQGLEVELNRASTLKFRVVGTDASVASLVLPNQIVLRDRWNLVTGRYIIQKRIPVREGDAIFYDYVCQDILAQLSREPVPYYETEEKTVREIVDDLMALQVQSNKIGVGIFDEAIASQTLAFYAQDTSVLGALNQLRDSLPQAQSGHFFVDYGGLLNWRLSVGLTGTINSAAITGLRYEISHDEQITRLYMYGEGQDPRTRLKLTDAGEAEEYLEDAAAVSSYGVLPAIKVEPSITDAETLLTVAQRVLDEYKEPHVTLDIDVIDLAKAQTSLFDEDDIYIGSEYTVTDSDLSINTTVKVRRIGYDLSNPLPLKVELDNRRPRLDDFIAELIRKQNPPLNVNDDGTLYPNITRFYDDGGNQFPQQYRNGDLRYGTAVSGLGDNEAYMFYRDSNEGGAGAIGNTGLDGPWTRIPRYVDVQDKLAWFVVSDVLEDYLECYRYYPRTDVTVNTETIYVAKPWLLQQTPFDGETVTYIDGDAITYTADGTNPEYKRNHDDGVDSADFVITPNYFVGEKLLAVQMDSTLTVGGNRVAWIEMPQGRYWARVE